jgi:hypothetical protein
MFTPTPIARALIRDAQVILLDEPFEGLGSRRSNCRNGLTLLRIELLAGWSFLRPYRLNAAAQRHDAKR